MEEGKVKLPNGRGGHKYKYNQKSGISEKRDFFAEAWEI
jgi:hypothetical protein